jgi:hypothetical protein
MDMLMYVNQEEEEHELARVSQASVPGTRWANKFGLRINKEQKK